MENPFAYVSIVSGEYLVDREQELAELRLDMRSSQNVVLVSPRRFGKTSLVLIPSHPCNRITHPSDGFRLARIDLRNQ